MLTSLNNYVINTKVSDYKENDLCLFSKNSYDLYADMMGITRTFKGEEFYFIDRKNLFGEECPQSLVSAINGIIYKIYFKHHGKTYEQCKIFREKLVDLIIKNMGNNPKINKKNEEHILGMWESLQGNVILETDGWDTAIFITSSSVKNAKKIGFFNRLFG